MFSIVIATRDRPELLRRALRSVAAQQFKEFELLIADDSSTEEMRQRNAEALSETVPQGVVLTGAAQPGGQGPSQARNRGMTQASRAFIAFLDDDDEWVDPEYLQAAAERIGRHGLDVYFADQVAVRDDGSVVTGPVWAEDLAQKLPAIGAAADDGVYRVGVAQLLLSDGFAHLNTTIVRRSLAWDELGGFDETIRYEEDRDFYLRLIDAAVAIGYAPGVVARHHVPAGRSSASSIATAEREASRLAVLDKALARAGNEALRARCRRDRAYTLKRMSTREAGLGQFAAAIRHGRAALRDQFGAKWAAFVASLYVRSAFSRRSHAD